MSPVSMAPTREPVVPGAPVVSYATLQGLLDASREMVVDWQLPSDSDRKG